MKNPTFLLRVVECSFARAGMLLCLLVLPGVTFAHTGPNHGADFLTGFLHPFTGMDHLLVAVAVGIWSVQLGRKAMWMLPVAFPAAMVIGAALMLAGIQLPLIEPMIAVSVVLLGIAIARSWQLGAVSSTALIALFAVFHGFAHAAEAPAGGSLATYAAGLLGTTVLLQFLGMVAGSNLAGMQRTVVRQGSGLLIVLIGAVNVLI